MKPAPILLHIEQLVLHDLPPGAREPLVAAMERELERLINEQGPPSSLTAAGDIERADGGVFVSRTSPTTNGTLLGRAIYKALSV